MPLQLDVSLPKGAQLRSLDVNGEEREPALKLNLDLRQDTELVLRFEVATMG